MIDPELRLAWIRALEEGRYSQTKGSLRDPEGFCCLGVACDVVDPDEWLSEDDYSVFKGECGYLPQSIRERLGLSWEQVRDLAKRNDDGVGFADIANFLRKEWGLSHE